VRDACGFAPYPRQYISYILKNESIVIDGYLNESAWIDVEWSSSFVDIMTNITPRFDTRMKMRWDNTYLYIGAQLEETQIWANLTQHDSVIFYDNDFEVFIDPDGDNHYYKEYEMNALNTNWELMLARPYLNQGPVLYFEMYPLMQTAVSISPDVPINQVNITYNYWQVEIAFPLADLAITNVPTTIHSHVSIPPNNGDRWRINFSRVEYHVINVNGTYWKNPEYNGIDPDNWVWSPQGVVNMHLPEMWGYLQFSTDPVNTTQYSYDPNWCARQALMNLYYAETAYNSQNNQSGIYYNDLEYLGLSQLLNLSCVVDTPDIQTTYHYFTGIIGSGQVREDRLLWFKQPSADYSPYFIGGAIGFGFGILLTIVNVLLLYYFMKSKKHNYEQLN